MKRMVLPVLGCTPFLLGELMSWGMMTVFYDILLPYALIGLVTLLLWSALAFCFGACAKSPIGATVLLNLPALLVVILLGVQELVLHAYWTDAIGRWSQMFFLPVLNIGFTLTSWSSSAFSAYCAAFVLMVAVSFLGFHLRQRRKGETTGTR